MEDMKTKEINVKTTFLHVYLEEVYMEQPIGFKRKGNEGLLCTDIR